MRVRGAVQGVGYRPFVYALAVRFGLSGFVLNDQEGVLLEIEGEEAELFLAALRLERPALARVDAVEARRIAVVHQKGFVIRPSAATGASRTIGVPDAATCALCVNDLFNPKSRFHLYPFVTCTDCGPRFTIAKATPYDRVNTTMSEFKPCSRCSEDYADPSNRRFHAQTISCPACGPRLSRPVPEIASALLEGKIVALKGVGGFHLLCDATNEESVKRLRRQKRRPERPFAVMISPWAEPCLFARPTQAHMELLSRSASPIVLVPKGDGLAASVAPRLQNIGLMLASAPIHHLVFAALRELGGTPTGSHALIVTSANLAGDPLVCENDQAVADLSSLADLIVTHDRTISQRADDSVLALIDGAPAFIRRGRGYAPEPIDLGEDGPPVVGAGSHLKATVCVTRGREAFVSQHLGDLDTPGAVRFYREALRRLVADLDVKPELVGCDRHPDHRTTVLAGDLGAPTLRVQHHMAHLAAVAAERGLGQSLIGVALDGYGYGLDGAAWGGELMRSTKGRWRRVGGLSPLALMGGERAARETWRMGLSAMVAAGRGAEAGRRYEGHPLADSLIRMGSSKTAFPLTTSMGRLFDAAASLLGVRQEQSYEGQAAMELEDRTSSLEVLADGFHLHGATLDFSPLLCELMQEGVDAERGAGLFHGTVIAGLAEWIGRYADEEAVRDIVLSGGCFANRVLANGLAHALRRRGLIPWLARSLPANDGGIALGQAALARTHLLTDRRAVTGLQPAIA